MMTRNMTPEGVALWLYYNGVYVIPIGISSDRWRAMVCATMRLFQLD